MRTVRLDRRRSADGADAAGRFGAVVAAANEGEGELERLLQAAATDPAARPAFTQALLASDVYALGTYDGELVDGVVRSGGSLQLVVIDEHEDYVTPFFTSQDALRRYVAAHPENDGPFVRIGCRELFERSRGMRLVLNPDSPFGKFFVGEEVDALLAGDEPGLTREVLQSDQQVMIGAAAHVPPELPAVLTRFFASRPMVEAAHLGWIAHTDGRSGYLLVVVASDADQAMSGFGSVNIGDVTDGKTLEVIVLPPGSTDSLLSTAPRFYTRDSR